MVCFGIDVAKEISEVHLTKLTNLLTTASKGRYGKEKATQT